MSDSDSDTDSDKSWQHPGWKEIKAAKHKGRFDHAEYVDVDFMKSWTVKLKFIKENALKGGNAFFLNVPGVETYHVVLTAAHNLISRDGTRTTKLELSYNNPGRGVTSFSPTPEDVYVCKEYEKSPVGDPSKDYGVIRIPKDRSEPQRGCNFSMVLAYEPHFSGKIYVTGYRTNTPESNPVTSTGSCISCAEEYVVYDAKTEQGISGSVVWIEYEKTYVAIAIHNIGPGDLDKDKDKDKSKNKSKDDNRGARITPKLLLDVYNWLSDAMPQRNGQLRVVDLRKKPVDPILPQEGLFLSFRSGFGFGRVRLGSGTLLDLIPAQVIGSANMYVLRTTEGKWLSFHPTGRMAVKLSEELGEKCLCMKILKPSPRVKIVVKMERMEEERIKEYEYELRMEGKAIKKGDFDNETSEVTFLEYPADNSQLFTRFTFE